MSSNDMESYTSESISINIQLEYCWFKKYSLMLKKNALIFS